MRPIPNLAVDFVARWEGCRLTAYRDVAGVLTIGFGHTGEHVSEGLSITRARARTLLKQDLGTAADRLEMRVGARVVEALSEPQYAALLSFVFNLGANPNWTIWKVLKARRFDEVPPQLMRFVNAGGRVIEGLVNRRAAEAALWHRRDHSAEDAASTPPSSVTRATETPPTPSDTKPLAKSKSFVATAATGLATAGVAVGEVSRAVGPYAAQSQVVERAVSALALVAAGLAVAALVFVWLKRRTSRQ